MNILKNIISMKTTLFFLFIAALGNVSYHIGQKSLPPSINPMVLLMAIYGIAFVLSAALTPFFKTEQTTAVMPLLLHWQVWLVAAGVLLIEIGFLLAYRTGISVQWSGVAVSGTAALLLIPVGLWLFKEHVSIERLIGIVTTLIGLYFLVKD